MREIQLPEASAMLSTVVEDARRGENSVIVRDGRPAAVVVGIEEWRKLSSVPSWGELLASCPVEDVDLTARPWGPMREPPEF